MPTFTHADLQVGDIVFGMFPVGDGRGTAPHFAMVAAVRDGTPIAIVGTSLKVSEGTVRFARDVFIVSPKTASQHWSETGLSKPTIFDFGSRGLRVRLTPVDMVAYNAHRTGTALAVLAGFVKRASN